jgi:hypothetical protein
MLGAKRPTEFGAVLMASRRVLEGALAAVRQALKQRRAHGVASPPRLTPIALIDDILGAHARALGNSFAAYRNHAQRVALSCESLAMLDDTERQQVHVAAAFHDLAIWTHGTFDYLAPAIGLADEYLERTGRASWRRQVAAMIDDHHKLRQPRHDLARLSDVFRRADLIDLACVHSVALHERPLDGVMQAFPSAGFHVLLAKLIARQFLRTPWDPLPAVRL